MSLWKPKTFMSKLLTRIIDEITAPPKIRAPRWIALLLPFNRQLKCKRCEGREFYRRREYAHIDEPDKVIEYQIVCDCGYQTKRVSSALEAEYQFEV